METKDAFQKPENNVKEADADQLDKAISLYGPAKFIYTPNRDYERVKSQLIHMQDNGDFKELDKYCYVVSGEYGKLGNFDIVAVVKIEQAQCAIYRGDLSAARRYVREGHEIAECTRCPLLFHAQAYLVNSNVCRNKNKLGKTKKCLDLAKQCFASCYSIEDLAHFYELYGSYLDKFLGVFPKEDEKAKKLALTNFNKMSEIGSRDSASRVSDKKRVYAMIRIARILLDSNSPLGRKHRKVTAHNIYLAAQCLEVIERDHLYDTMPRGSKIQYQMVKSDLFYRQGKFEDAIALLQKSLHEAKEFGYDVTEGPKITQRLEEIDLIMNERAIKVVNESTVEMESSSGYDSESSQNESDHLFSSDDF